MKRSTGGDVQQRFKFAMGMGAALDGIHRRPALSHWLMARIAVVFSCAICSGLSRGIWALICKVPVLQPVQETGSQKRCFSFLLSFSQHACFIGARMFL
jgi:hypothetical protein